MTKKWPPLDPGTRIKTTQPDIAEWHQWTGEGLKAKRWGAEGVIVGHHDSHGLCYDVRHEDEVVVYYGPLEFAVLELPQQSSDTLAA